MPEIMPAEIVNSGPCQGFRPRVVIHPADRLPTIAEHVGVMLSELAPDDVDPDV
jgi:hypothetical protein